MHLVQVLLPLGKRFRKTLYGEVLGELTERFGGVTAYARAPAKGLWKPKPGTVEKDDIVVYEVMVEKLDKRWWKSYRQRLEERFEQDELVIRAQEMRKL